MEENKDEKGLDLNITIPLICFTILILLIGGTVGYFYAGNQKPNSECMYEKLVEQLRNPEGISRNVIHLDTTLGEINELLTSNYLGVAMVILISEIDRIMRECQ